MQVQSALDAAEVPDLELSAAQSLIANGSGAASLLETFVALGSDALVVEVFYDVLGKTPRDAWQAAVKSGSWQELDDLRRTLVKACATRRVIDSLSDNPLVSSANLIVTPPISHDVDALDDLGLSGPDGLAPNLDDAQRELIRSAQQALTLTYYGANDPYTLTVAAERTDFPALRGVHEDELGTVLPAARRAVLLFGADAARRLAEAQIESPTAPDDVLTALEDHANLVKTKVPAAGCALFARTEATRSGKDLGVFLAAVAGASYSERQVIEVIAARVSALDEEGQRSLSQLGHLTYRALLDQTMQKKLLNNARTLLGGNEFLQVEQRARESAQRYERTYKRDPWNKRRQKGDDPVHLAITTSAQLAQHGAKHADAAATRLVKLLYGVGSSGGHGRRDANARLGYATTFFGMRLVEGLETDTLAATREALQLTTAARR